MGKSRTRQSVEAQEQGWLEATDYFLIDLDGTLIRDGRATAGAVDLLRVLAGRFAVLSNNSSDTAAGLSRRLLRYGLPVGPDELVLAGEHTVRKVALDYPGARIMLLGSTPLIRLATRLGLQVTPRDPHVVVLTRDVRFSYQRLGAAANAIRNGAKFVVSNPDRRHPGRVPHGIVPETGALMQAVLACTGNRPTPTIIGKPESGLFSAALQRLGGAEDNTLVIGDNPDTDAVGAVRLGMGYLLVGDSDHADAPDLKTLMNYTGVPHRQLDALSSA